MMNNGLVNGPGPEAVEYTPVPSILRDEFTAIFAGQPGIVTVSFVESLSHGDRLVDSTVIRGSEGLEITQSDWIDKPQPDYAEVKLHLREERGVLMVRVETLQNVGKDKSQKRDVLPAGASKNHCMREVLDNLRRSKNFNSLIEGESATPEAANLADERIKPTE